MSEPRELCVVQDYDGLLAAVRARAEELNVSRETISAACELQRGYAGTILCGSKSLGRKSMGKILKGLGLVLIVAEEPGAAERLRALPKRQTARLPAEESATT